MGKGNPNPVHKFQKGEINNPNGAPLKEFSFTSAMREFLGEVNPDTKKHRKDELVQKVYQFAMRGDPTLIKLIINYLEGMPKGSETNVNVGIINYQASQQEADEWAIGRVKELIRENKVNKEEL